MSWPRGPKAPKAGPPPNLQCEDWIGGNCLTHGSVPCRSCAGHLRWLAATNDRDAYTGRPVYYPAMPEGLCGNFAEHEPHRHDSTTLGEFWCHALQDERVGTKAHERRLLL